MFEIGQNVDKEGTQKQNLKKASMIKILFTKKNNEPKS